jgi:hypothetical protein
MTATYEVIRFEREFEVEDEWATSVIAVELSEDGTSEYADQQNLALLRTIDPDETDTERVSEDSPSYCGVNGCQRTVDEPDGSCWQHTENDE